MGFGPLLARFPLSISTADVRGSRCGVHLVVVVFCFSGVSEFHAR